MDLPDVNVLVYALRGDLEHSLISQAWLNGVINGEAQFAVSRLALSAVVRITTNRRIFREPSTLAEAFEFCRALVAQPNCHLVEPGERHWSIFQRLCTDANVVGPKVTDAWFAALAIEHGCEWITFDRDFAQFSGLRWRAPA
jgi:hypothetical protein